MNLEAELEAFKQALIVGGGMALAIAAVAAVTGYTLHKVSKGASEWAETCMMVAGSLACVGVLFILWVLILFRPLYP